MGPEPPFRSDFEFEFEFTSMGRRDDARRAEEALAAIPGRFHRLLTCAQLYHTRSTRGCDSALRIYLRLYFAVRV